MYFDTQSMMYQFGHHEKKLSEKHCLTSLYKLLSTLKKPLSYFRLPKGSEQRLKLHQSATARLGSACYVEGAMSSMLFLALEFADDVNAGLLANANCGGKRIKRSHNCSLYLKLIQPN